MSTVKCTICPWNCEIEENKIGFCGARGNIDGRIKNVNYGKVAAIALDPIEKKPLKMFFPGTTILSVGSNGCNLRCPFCQNYNISMAADWEIETLNIQPEELVQKAISLKPEANIGIAFTYNEPLTWYDYVLDTAKLSKAAGLKNVLVTNGYINQGPLKELLPYIDAMNIDLKSFTEEGYKSIGGKLETVKNTIVTASKSCHVEVTTLVVTGENDTIEEMEKLSSWLASVDSEIPLHITRFFPKFKTVDREATSVPLLHDLSEVAKKYLKNVFVGNI